jgi:hypothetical protein
MPWLERSVPLCTASFDRLSGKDVFDVFSLFEAALLTRAARSSRFVTLESGDIIIKACDCASILFMGSGSQDATRINQTDYSTKLPFRRFLEAFASI